MKHFKYVFGIALFLITISFPLINNSFKLIKDIASTENKGAISRPEFKIEKLDPFPAQYEKYYDNHFSLRNKMIQIFNFIHINFLKQSPNEEQVIVGKNNWLFLGGNEMDSYTGKNAMTDSEIESFKKELEYRADYLKQRNCIFYFLVVPIKATIYSEYLPATTFKVTDITNGQKLLNYLNKNSKLNTINLYDCLYKNKSKSIYYQLDNHWNELGAFIGANEVLKQLKKDFKEIDTNDIDNYDKRDSLVKTGNLYVMLSKVGNFNDTYVHLAPKNGFMAKDTNNGGYKCPEGFPYPWEFEAVKVNPFKKKKIFIVSDSFGKVMFPYVAEHFRKSVKVFDNWEYKINENIVEKEKPDVMLLMILESNLQGLLKHQSSKK